MWVELNQIIQPHGFFGHRQNTVSSVLAVLQEYISSGSNSALADSSSQPSMLLYTFMLLLRPKCWLKICLCVPCHRTRYNLCSRREGNGPRRRDEAGSSFYTTELVGAHSKTLGCSTASSEHTLTKSKRMP